MTTCTSSGQYMPSGSEDRYWSPWQENRAVMRPTVNEREPQSPTPHEWPHDNAGMEAPVPKRHLIEREFIKFCENTSLRGIPRIVKAKNSFTKSMWLTSVIILFVACFASMCLLTGQYKAYDVIHPPRVMRDKPSPFPSVTVCNLRPLSSEGKKFLKDRHVLDPRSFASVVNLHAARMYYPKNSNYSNAKHYSILTSAFNLGGFMESLTFNYTEKQKMGHQRDKFILKCQLSYEVGSSGVAQPCEMVGHWVPFIHATYLNCFTLNLESQIREKARTLELYLYLNEDSNFTSCVDCFRPDVKSQLSGALMAIHNAETYPDINQKSINLPPGSLTEFKLKTLQNKQKEPPYGRCSSDTPERIKLHNTTYVYSENACREAETQREINKVCNCNAIENPIKHENLKYCSQMTSFILGKCGHPGNPEAVADLEQCSKEIRDAVERLTCKYTVTNKYKRDTIENCSLPCSFYSYESDRSTSIWPTKSWQLGWLSKMRTSFLMEKPEIQPYMRAIQLLKTDQEGAMKILRQADVLEKNLLAIVINRPDYTLHVVEEKEVFSLPSFLSQTGGLFSIFIGLTLLGVVEIFELTIHCVEILRGRNPEALQRTTENEMIKNDTAQKKPNSAYGSSKEARHLYKHEVVL